MVMQLWNNRMNSSVEVVVSSRDVVSDISLHNWTESKSERN